jgi:signal transduction histidine kinase
MHVADVPARTRAITPELAAASIAHEVSQPLTGILTNATMCLRMLAADPPNIDAACEAARRTLRDGTRASDVLVRLRALFSDQDLARQSVDLNEATRAVLAQSLLDFQRAGVVVQPDFADELPCITGDPIQLQQVISNLLRNAADAMLGIDDRPRLLVIRTERQGADRVVVTVRDTGIGIDPASIHKLFDAFYTTKSAGLGVGLAVSRSIVERHQGRLWAESNNGPGATFCFSIPCNPECNGGSYDSERHAHCLCC